MKILLNKDQKLFFTSDTHYNHVNICTGQTRWNNIGGVKTRNFNTVEDMNKVIVDNINNLVGKKDILIHLGDWSFGGMASITDLREKINCEIVHLFTGNHDEHIEANKHVLTHYKDLESDKIVRGEYNEPEEDKFGTELDNKVHLQDFFSTVQKYSEVEVISEIHDKVNLVLMHFPIVSWHNMRKGAIHLHGHTHFTEDKKIQQGKMMDVGVDGNNLKPYELSEVMDIMNLREAKSMFKSDN